MFSDAETPATDIAAFIESGAASTGDNDFNKLALRLFARQYARNAPYRSFCDGRGMTPALVSDWRQVPAAPASAFKHFALTTATPEECTPEHGGRVFHSSGTTGSETSRHYLNKTALNLYCVSLRAGYKRFVLPDGVRLPIFALMPPPADAPNSSLSFMLQTLIDDYGGGFYAGDSWQTRLAGALRELTTPVVLFGTAFAWVQFFDVGEARFVLPSGSRIVETGGFKGRSREISRDELYALLTERLGVGASDCIAEYGMSEMASQFYDSSLFDATHQNHRPPRKIAPPWLHTRVMNPVTGDEAQPGENGLLAHYDLANFNSVFAIQTEDYGHTADDEDGFILLGRTPGAILRGCSLLAEEIAQSPAG